MSPENVQRFREKDMRNPEPTAHRVNPFHAMSCRAPCLRLDAQRMLDRSDITYRFRTAGRRSQNCSVFLVGAL